MKKLSKKNKKRILTLGMVVVLTASLFIGPQLRTKAASITQITAQTFRSNTGISTIHIGSDVTDISSSSFRGLMNLRSITVSKNNPFYTSYSNCLYNKEMTELLCFPAALSGAVIPESVVSIRENALYGVGESLKAQIKSVVKDQASENIMEDQVPGAHFIHTPSGLKWKNADGSIKDPDTELMKLAASVVDTSTTQGLSQRKQLEKCFNYFVNTSSYVRKLDVPLGDWTASYAKEILATGKGNCYNYASGFAYIAKGLGFDAKVCTGTVTSSLGGRTAHAWTEVKIGDNWYIFDAEMQGAKGSGYYKQTYDSYPAGPLMKEASWTVSF